MKSILKYIREKFIEGFVYFLCAFVSCALCFQLFFLYVEITAKEKNKQKMVNDIMWKIDGSFKK
jgi:hypothetical protein